MPDDPQPNPDEPKVEPGPESDVKPKEEEVGDFINRHVFEKDSVFFEG